MDRHATEDHDASSFDLPSTHRLPTVSAAQALQDLEGNDGNFIPTGLTALDALLGSGLDRCSRGGIQKGHVTEIWGPPGVGKTAFGIQLASHCLGERRGVVWVDGFHRMPVDRLRVVSSEDLRLVDGFTHYTCPSLPHLLGLLCKPTASCIPQGTSLIVIDSLSALVNHAFPKVPEARPVTDAKGSKGPSISARRLQVLQCIVSSLQKLAATRELAVVVLMQCATKMRAEHGAILIPAVNASVWEQGISTRLVLFRDWLKRSSEVRGVRFVEIQKLNGKGTPPLIDNVCAFKVEEGGLVAVDYDNTQQSRALAPTPAQKRKLRDTDFEIADSGDEDYGWDDDEFPPMPSQWQGSEDILLVRQPESDDSDHQDDEKSLDNVRGNGDEDQEDTEPASPAVKGPHRGWDRPLEGAVKLTPDSPIPTATASVSPVVGRSRTAYRNDSAHVGSQPPRKPYRSA